MEVLRGLQTSGRLSRTAHVPRAHCTAAITNLVKAAISHGIFRVLEAGAVSWRAEPGSWALLLGLLPSPWGSA